MILIYNTQDCSNDMWPVDYDGNPLIGEKRSIIHQWHFDALRKIENQGYHKDHRTCCGFYIKK